MQKLTGNILIIDDDEDVYKGSPEKALYRYHH